MKLLISLYLSILLMFGYTFNSNNPYIIANTNIGNIHIYFAENIIDYLSIENNSIINTNTSIIYGYTNDYRITFQTYSIPTYQNGYNTQILEIYEIIENHLYDTRRTINKNYYIYTYAILGGLLIWVILHIHH